MLLGLTITEAFKRGRYHLNEMDRLSNSATLRAFELAEQIKRKPWFLILQTQYRMTSSAVTSSATMMADWANGDKDLFAWREATGKTVFEKMHQNMVLSIPFVVVLV